MNNSSLRTFQKRHDYHSWWRRYWRSGRLCCGYFYRGIPYIQIPTTLLSQVDSSIGGKVGVHFKGLTNMIGSIYPPESIIISTRFLETLPQREFSCGISEMLKIGFIHDRPLFQQLLASPKIGPYPGLEDLICQSIANKNALLNRTSLKMACACP